MNSYFNFVSWIVWMIFGIFLCVARYQITSKLSFKNGTNYDKVRIITSWITYLVFMASIVFGGTQFYYFVQKEKETRKSAALVERVKADHQAMIDSTPYTTGTEITKVTTAVRHETMVNSAFIISIEFRSQSGYVYRRITSLTYEDSQVKLYHELLFAYQNGEPLVVKYKHKKQLDPTRVLVSITGEDGKVLWSSSDEPSE